MQPNEYVSSLRIKKQRIGANCTSTHTRTHTQTHIPTTHSHTCLHPHTYTYICTHTHQTKQRTETLLLVRTYPPHSEVFGAVLSHPPVRVWKRFVGDGTTFVFSLSPHEKSGKYVWKGGKNRVMCVYVRMCVCVCVCMCVCSMFLAPCGECMCVLTEGEEKYVCMCMYACVRVYVPSSSSMWNISHICECVYVCVCVCMCMYVCMCVCVCVCVCTRIFFFAQTHFYHWAVMKMLCVCDPISSLAPLTSVRPSVVLLFVVRSTYTHIHTHTHTHTHTHMHTQTYMHTHTHARVVCVLFLSLNVSIVYVCVCVYMCVYVHVCMCRISIQDQLH